MLRGLVIGLIVMAGLSAGAVKALAFERTPQRFAVIIGVSQYKILPPPQPGKLSSLESPAHDVARIVKTAYDLGVKDENMTVLADHLVPAEISRKSDGDPTRAAIMAALQRLITQAGRGDQVFIYFSGHGAQQPHRQDPRLPDRGEVYDELILPSDISYWNDRDQNVPGSISNAELSQIVRSIRAKGAFVWLVVDACHSGGILRGATANRAGAEVKGLPASFLKIPAKAFERAQAKAATSLQAEGLPKDRLDLVSSDWGGVAAFYAAGADQTALAQDIEGVRLSVMTAALTQSLTSGEASSYRDLALKVQAFYEAPQFYDIERQPVFDGDLDRAILGQAIAPRRQWRVRRVNDHVLELDGGLLDGVHLGDILAVRYAELSEKSEVVGYLRVDKIDAARARLVPVDYNKVLASASSQINPQGRGFVATQVEIGVPFVVKVGLPALSAQPSGMEARLASAIRLIVNDPSKTPGVFLEFTRPGDQADIYLRLGQDRIWLSDQAEGFARTGRNQPTNVVGGEDENKFTDRLALQLRAIARSLVLQRALTAVELGEARSRVSVEYLIDRPKALHVGASGGDQCGPGPIAPYVPPKSAVTLNEWLTLNGGQPRLRTCDIVYFRVKNTSSEPIDVTPLYFAKDGTIVSLQLSAYANEDVIIVPGASRVYYFQVITEAENGAELPLGREQLAIILVPEHPGDFAPQNYAYLRQAAPHVASRGKRSRFEELLDAAGFNTGQSRGSIGARDAAVIRSSWLVDILR